MNPKEVSAFIVKEGLKTGADEIAAIAAHDTSRQVRFANNEITVTKTWDQTSASILLKKDRKILIASVTDTTEDSIRNILKKLAHTVNIMKPHESYAPLPERPIQISSNFRVI